MPSPSPDSLASTARRTVWDERSPQWRRGLAIIHEDGPDNIIRDAVRETLDGEVDDVDQMTRVVNYTLEQACEDWWADKPHRSTFRRDRHREIDFSEHKDIEDMEPL